MRANKSLKNNKAPGPDGLNAELFKADPELAAEVILPLLTKAWKEKKIPEEWNEGVIIKIPKKGTLGTVTTGENLRKIARIFWPQRTSNEELLEHCQQESIEKILVERRWKWIGHVLRKSQNAITIVAVQWKPEGRRKRGRPKTTWRRTAEAEAATMGQSWGTLRTLAQDREKWGDFVAALVAHGKKGSE
ncbi:LINE-1 retrotransposable element ORF2 protein [Elysia marginata]|uniref:LINE-1 retrotransposable element ORF2 protein n=1 Tax=Elysia marginata TaxID=1093978 RepID=A0AAV4H564_9GAST|nr:LINE-1 retrotransposable element ORF2 protein [Elysia marginata]